MALVVRAGCLPSEPPPRARCGARGRLIAAGVVSALLITAGVHSGPVSASLTLTPYLYSGWQVDKSTGAEVCAVSSGERCGVGAPSGEAGGFKYLTSVAVAPATGDVYVADTGNDRVEVLSASGAFLSTFGAPGYVGYPSSLAVAPTTGDVYVLEIGPENYRIDKYTAAGRFVWTVGSHVNASTGGDLCTEKEVRQARVRCGEGMRAGVDSIAPAVFKFTQFAGNLLAVGGPEELLYVGDEHRIQEFDSSGKWRGEILLAALSGAPQSAVSALAVDQRGILYVVYRVANPLTGAIGEDTGTIHEFDAQGEPLGQIVVPPLQAQASVGIVGIAVDRFGQLAVVGGESGPERGGEPRSPRFGALSERDGGGHFSRFQVPNDYDGIAFNASGDLYVAATDDQEVVGYVPAQAQELLTSPTACKVGIEASLSFSCTLSTLAAGEP